MVGARPAPTRASRCSSGRIRATATGASGSPPRSTRPARPCRSRATPTSRRSRRCSSTATASSRTPGTILLDALVNDRPAVCVLYDEGAPAGESRGRCKNVVGEHYREVAGSGAFHRAESFEEVVAGIERCLASPGELATSGARVVQRRRRRGRRPRRRARRRGDARRARLPVSAPAIVGIYRAANAPHVERLLAPALAAGWTAAWWALDETAPVLGPHTVGEGPGAKLPLLQAAIERHGPPEAELVLSDDDIAFGRGDVTTFLDLARPGAARSRAARARRRLGGQPRHHARAAAVPRAADDVRRERPAGRDRFALGRAGDAASRWRGMGWGIELDWIDLGLPLGIVDAVPVRTSARSPAATTTPRSAPVPRGARGAWCRRLGAAAADPRRLAAVAAPPAVEGDVIFRRRSAAGPAADASRRPLVLARGRPCRRGAPAVSGVSRGDPSLRISLVLNGASPTELATCVPCVERAFPVPYSSFGAEDGDPRRALRGVPRDWDHVVHHPASIDPEQQRFEGLQALLRGRAPAFPRSPERGCHRRPAASLRAAPGAAPRPAARDARAGHT